ncbi:MAG: hypothetical protein ACI4TE_01860 [Alphaproteobacteria bacterium]
MNDVLMQCAAWFGGFVFFVWRMEKRLAVLEFKVDDLRERQGKYNNLQVRMIEVEQRSKSNTHRIDRLEEE